MQEEQIIFVSKTGEPTGETGPKLASHNAHTRLHLAFSCYLFNPVNNYFLLTQRAHDKKVWPDVWTNSVCGHPMPGESIITAIKRRAEFELGLSDISNLICMAPNYTYKTPPYNGIIEHEYCPVYAGYTTQEPKLNKNEVESYRWITWQTYAGLLSSDIGKNTLSYWSKDQYRTISAQMTMFLAQ